MMGLGVGEIFLILAALVIFVGPKKIPELARSMGKMINEFNRAKNDILHEVKSSSNVTESENDDESSPVKLKDDLVIPSLNGAMLSQAKPPSPDRVFDIEDNLKTENLKEDNL